MNGTNCNTDERGLLPYPVILAATKGDPEAMVDEDLRERLQSKLMRAVLSFKADK